MCVRLRECMQLTTFKTHDMFFTYIEISKARGNFIFRKYFFVCCKNVLCLKNILKQEQNNIVLDFNIIIFLRSRKRTQARRGKPKHDTEVHFA